MGVVEGVGRHKYPKQSDYVGKRTEVAFEYDWDNTIKGTFVRDDRDGPGETIILLDNGRFVRGVECMYTMPK